MSKKKLNINDYLPQLQTNYQRDLLLRIAEVLKSRGISIESDKEVEHLFKERIKGQTFNGVTSLTLDGTPLCEYGQLHAEMVNDEIKTSFKFREA